MKPTDDTVAAGLAAARVFTGISVRAVAAAGDVVTLPQLRVLVLVGDAGGTNIATLADGLGVHPSNATRVVERLTRAGLLDRRPDPDDRRHLVVELTPAGRRVVEDVDARRQEEIERLLDDLPADRRTGARGVLRALAEAGGETVDAAAASLGWAR